MTKATPQSLALLALITTTLLFAQQDIWIARILKNVDPLVMTFWNFIVVMVMALVVALFKKQKLWIPRASLYDLIGLNIATLTSWIFTFMALTQASPAVVAAGTLSAPLFMRLVFFEKVRDIPASAWVFFAPIFLGLALGAVEEGSSLSLNGLALLYCFVASLGVVGNSHFMKRLNHLSMPSDVVLFYRFFLLIGSVFVFFILRSGTIPKTPLTATHLCSLALVTSYIPLWLLYHAHRHLEIFIINIFLALTPVFSILLLFLDSGRAAFSLYQILSVVFILAGVLFGYQRIYRELSLTNT